AVAGLAGALLMPLAAQETWTLYALLIVWGGAIVGLNTCSLTLIGARFSGRELAAANAGLAFAYNAGALAGPASAGPMMDLFGPDALAFTLAAFFAALLALLMARRTAETP
ncbi:MAG: MFS transporter, partial [Pseudomonadota bacterium]